MSITYKRVSTKKEIKVVAVSQAIPIQYPHTWFADNHTKKPGVTKRVHNHSTSELRRGLLRGLAGEGMSREVAKAYLFSAADLMTETLDSDWSSYGVLIGKKGDQVNPLSLLDVTTSSSGLPAFNMCEANKDESDRNVLLLVLSVYRVLRISNDDGREKIIEGLKRQLEKKSDNSIEQTTSESNAGRLMEYVNWQNDRDYHKLVAAYDMFLFKFPHNDYAMVRFGSIGSRFRDCAALLSISHISETFGIAPDDLPDWIYTNQIADELVNMMHPLEQVEMNSPNSYFPYQSDLGLVQRTAYSSVANPNLFFFLHVAGTLYGSSRSKNARHNTESNLENNTVNAIIFANAFKRNTKMTKAAFTVDGEELEAASEPDLVESFSSTNGSEWFDFMSKENFRLTSDMKEFVKQVKKQLGQSRDNTIGKYIENYNLL